MKETTLQTLITARALFEQAERQCGLGDRYLSTAGLIVLQDAVELVFLAVLSEKNVDDVERLKFDDMIKQIQALGISVPKSGALKAMNKLRVTAKHYGEIMEPLTVQNHLASAKGAIDAILVDAVGKPLREVFLTELVGSTPSRSYLDQAAIAFQKEDYFDALVYTRKAYFVEFEQDYNIFQYRDYPAEETDSSFFLTSYGGGCKADVSKRNRNWISANVRTVFDYIQLDYETWRVDAMEWGINTRSLNNIRSLTPSVAQLNRFDGEWYIRRTVDYEERMATRKNASMCLDLTIECIRRKHEYYRSMSFPTSWARRNLPDSYVGQPVFACPDTNSEILSTLQEEDVAIVQEELHGFSINQIFYGIYFANRFGIWGYVEKISDEVLQEYVSPF